MKDEDGGRITYFVPSPPMSTYLVAFVVSDLECLGSNLKLLNGSRLSMNICVRPIYKNKTDFAIEVATKAMKFFLNVFEVDYPLPKLGNS